MFGWFAWWCRNAICRVGWHFSSGYCFINDFKSNRSTKVLAKFNQNQLINNYPKTINKPKSPKINNQTNTQPPKSTHPIHIPNPHTSPPYPGLPHRLVAEHSQSRLTSMDRGIGKTTCRQTRRVAAICFLFFYFSRETSVFWGTFSGGWFFFRF